jgi:hypothetical protein
VKPPIPVTYIAGVSFCGSTLLAIVLNTHPEIVSVGEMGPSKRFGDSDYECSCGVRIVECPFYAAVQARMQELGVAFDPGDMRLRHNYSVGQHLERLSYRTIGVPAPSTCLARARSSTRPSTPSASPFSCA